MKKFVAFLAIQSLVLAACSSQPVSQPAVKTAQRELIKSKRGPAATDAQKRADDQCFAGYSGAASRCNDSVGEDDAAFSRCLKPAKNELKRCCQASRGSAECAAGAMPLNVQTTNAIDDKCFAEYFQAAGGCNDSSGNDDSAFGPCLSPVKEKLKACCRYFGGSSKCAADAQ